jgi:hypothetical protein
MTNSTLSTRTRTDSEAKSLAASAAEIWITFFGVATRYSSAIDFLAVPDAEDQHNQAVVFDLRDEPVITHAVFPELSKLRAVQSLSDAARIVQLGDSLMKELQDAPGLLRVEFAEFSVR